MTTANSPASKEVVTAALLVIGSKILSGRTKDQNIGHIAQYLTALGTTGGIGPNHGDITTSCVAKAFGVPIDADPRARGCARGRYRHAARRDR